MYSIAVCFYGFTRNALNVPDLELFFRQFFGTEPLDIAIYYATYSASTEFDAPDTRVDVGVVETALRRNNANVRTVRVSTKPYSETECLRHVKGAGAKRVFNSLAKVFLHREYSMYTCMKRCVDLIEQPVDFVCVSRTDWGINQITTPRKVNIVEYLNDRPGVVAGHLNGSITKNHKLLSTDPRFMFGRRADMSFVSELPTLFLQHIGDVKDPNSVMHVHAFVSYILKRRLAINIISHNIMFGVMKNLPDRVCANRSLNSSLEQRRRLQEVFDRLT